MDATRKLERIIFTNPVAQVSDYPSLDAFSYTIMDMESWCYDKICYAYVRKDNCEKWFIDIYFYELQINGSKREQRFVIAPGCMMNEEAEDAFINKLDDIFLDFSERVNASFVEDLRLLAPELNLLDVRCSFSEVLLKVYYSSHRCGVRELLYKSGLNIIAKRLSSIDEYNMLATSLEQAFNVPLKMLRKLNSHFGVYVLSTEKERKVAKHIYVKFHSCINDIEEITEYQYQYLRECMCGREKMDKRVLLQFGNLVNLDEDDDIDSCDDIYTEYLQYRRNYLAISEYRSIFPAYPSLAEPERFLFLSKFAKDYMKCKAGIDAKLRKQYIRVSSRYCYEDSKYIIIIPQTIQAILTESNAMHNCLYTYIDMILEGYTTVVFMRQKGNVNKSLVCIEIRNGYVYQAKRAFNEEVTEEQRMFIEKYCEAKSLIYQRNLGCYIDFFDEDNLPFN